MRSVNQFQRQQTNASPVYQVTTIHPVSFHVDSLLVLFPLTVSELSQYRDHIDAADRERGGAFQLQTHPRGARVAGEWRASAEGAHLWVPLPTKRLQSAHHATVLQNAVRLELKSKWLMTHVGIGEWETLADAVVAQFRQFGLAAEREDVLLSRVDVAVDLAGLDMNTIPLETWQKGWVGGSSELHAYSKDGQIDGLQIGLRKSALFLRIYDKGRECEVNGGLPEWKAVWASQTSEPVTRIEYSIRTRRAGFANLQTLNDVTRANALSVLAYATGGDWGRLCTPSATDRNRSRWPVHPVWKSVCEAVEGLADAPVAPAVRMRRAPSMVVSDHELRSTGGRLSSLCAKVGHEQALGRPSTVDEVVERMAEAGVNLPDQAAAKYRAR